MLETYLKILKKMNKSKNFKLIFVENQKNMKTIEAKYQKILGCNNYKKNGK